MNEQLSPLAYSCGGDKFVHLLGLSRCAHCDAAYKPKTKTAMYCTKVCKASAWKAKNPQKWAAHAAKAAANKRARFVPKPKTAPRKQDKAALAMAAREAARRLHTQDARVTTCAECEARFCPLYGSSHATLCAPCAVSRSRAAKHARKAIERAATVEMVDPFKVFDRDRWRCQLCGIKTPKAKRGTYADNAPELDHIMPLAKGGDHSYRNTQCACRKCNGAKSDRPMGQMLLVG